jgi:hypothetical protein
MAVFEAVIESHTAFFGPIITLDTPLVIELLPKVNKAVISFPYSCPGFTNKHNHKHHNREHSFEIFETYIGSGSCLGNKRIIRRFCD